MINIHPHRLTADNAVLLVIDIQERFLGVIHKSDKLLSNTAKLIEGCAMLDVPIVVTEQYPQGLGYTASALKNVLPENTPVIEKTTFSAFPVIDETLKALGKKQIIVCGIEAHVCVNQTVLDLIANDYQAHLVTDCLSGRYKDHIKSATKKMIAAGAIHANLELVLFELMHDAKHPHFKKIQGLIKGKGK